jgi:hypothetical protein
MSRKGFMFSSAFPADDLLSEYVATLAVAFNDLSHVHVRIEEDADVPHKRCRQENRASFHGR